MTAGEYYHIYNRGNNCEKIFYEDDNYQFFLKKFDQYLSVHVEVLAYCLMPNHFHFFIRVRDNSLRLPLAFKNFFISYSKSINKKYQRTGSLFQAGFKKKEITDDFYYTSLILYIHLNPVVAGLCRACSDWKYSSYNAFTSKKPSKVKTAEILRWFGNAEDFVKAHEISDELFYEMQNSFINDSVGAKAS